MFSNRARTVLRCSPNITDNSRLLNRGRLGASIGIYFCFSPTAQSWAVLA